MKTALLLAGAADVRQYFSEAFGAQINIVLLETPAEPDAAHFDALFETWLRLVDIVVVDAVSLGATTRWAMESLAKVTLGDHQAVIVRLTADQRLRHPLEPGWLAMADTENLDQSRQNLGTFLELRATQSQLKQATGGRRRSTGKSPPPAGICWARGSSRRTVALPGCIA